MQAVCLMFFFFFLNLFPSLVLWLYIVNLSLVERGFHSLMMFSLPSKRNRWDYLSASSLKITSDQRERLFKKTAWKVIGQTLNHIPTRQFLLLVRQFAASQGFLLVRTAPLDVTSYCWAALHWSVFLDSCYGRSELKWKHHFHWENPSVLLFVLVLM